MHIVTTRNHLVKDAFANGFAWTVICTSGIGSMLETSEHCTHVSQFDLGQGSILVVHGYTLNSVQRGVCAIYDLAEDSVFPVEMSLLCIGNKELGLVRVWTGICHCNNAACIELKTQ